MSKGSKTGPFNPNFVKILYVMVDGSIFNTIFPIWYQTNLSKDFCVANDNNRQRDLLDL